MYKLCESVLYCRVRLQAQLVTATAKLSAAAVAQADLIMQRDQLTEQLTAAEERAAHILDHVRAVYDALALEKTLRPNLEMLSSLDTVLRSATVSASTSGGGA